MPKLKVIENQLVPVYITDAGAKVVYGTELHAVLEVKSRYREWIDRRLSDIEAVENKDYQAAEISAASGQVKKEHIIRLNTAKEMAMLERNEKGRQVRRYFIQVEEKYKQKIIDRSQLSPETQALMALTESIARTELEQKRQAEQINRLEQKQETLTQTFSMESTKDFRPWVKQCITAISESPCYRFFGTKPEKYQAVTKESYDRLNKKKPCRLKQRVESEKGRALNAGASTARVNAINKLTIIENDKALKPLYEMVLKEMMIAYCANISSKKNTEEV